MKLTKCPPLIFFIFFVLSKNQLLCQIKFEWILRLDNPINPCQHVAFVGEDSQPYVAVVKKRVLHLFLLLNV
jgi:hypothetical protein